MMRSVLSVFLLLTVTLPAPLQAWNPPSAQEQHVRTLLQQRTIRAQKRLTQTLSHYVTLHVTRTSSSATVTGTNTRFDRRQEEVLRLVNRARSAAHLPLLTLHPLLNESAQRYASWMHTAPFFSHTDPDGRSSLDRIRDTGYIQAPCACSWQYVTGENLASGMKTPAEAVRAWMESPAHRANLLHPRFEHLGVGYADGIWVQHFGSIWEEERT